MRCPNCSQEVTSGSDFCDQCGTSLKTAGAPAQTPVTPPPPVPVAPVASPQPPPPAAPIAPVVPQAPATVKCNKCGTENLASNAFCDNCSAPLVAPPPAPPRPATPPLPSPQPTAPMTPPAPAQATPRPATPPPPSPQPVAPITPPTPAQATPRPPTPLPAPPQPIAPITPPAPAQATPPPPTPPPAPPQPSAPARPQMIPATQATQPPQPGHPRIVVMPSGVYFDISGRNEIVIGRLDPITPMIPDIDLTAHGGDDAGVSRKHSRITLAGNQYFIEDLGSSNGTTVNSVMIDPPNVRKPLNNGDQVRLGRLVLNFYTS